MNFIQYFSVTVNSIQKTELLGITLVGFKVTDKLLTIHSVLVFL
jgi:hypothetical protein